MPVQRIVMPDGSTKAFPESASKADIDHAINQRWVQMREEGHPVARSQRRVPVTQAASVRKAGMPALPPGEDVDRNIQRMEMLRDETRTSWLDFVIPLFGMAVLGRNADKRLKDFTAQVDTGRPWDYKQLGLKAYEAGGNFNYGAAGAAAGIPDWLLYRAAGWMQKPNTGGSGIPWLTYPYGDDVRDQEQIKRGIEYYRNRRQ